MIINDLDGYYIVFDTKNWNTELDTLIGYWLLVVGSFVWKTIPSVARVTRDKVSGLKLNRKELSGRQYQADKTSI